MTLDEGKKIYFASDFHLGLPNAEESRIREKEIVRWLDSIKEDAQELFLVGDIFDFWYEYKHVVPRGFIRFLGKLAELSDCGIKINLFAGNHDVWIKDYFIDEFNAKIYRRPLKTTINGKSFYIHHGHALGNYDKTMNILNAMFESPFLQWCFSRIHPNGALGFGLRWSSHNRQAKVYESSNFLGEEKEWLLLHSKDVLQSESYDYFIYGHRHVPMIKQMNSKTTLYNLGNWIGDSTYAVFDGEKVELKRFLPEKNNSEILSL